MIEEIVFDVCDISYAYEEKQAALEHVNLKVPAGESLVILGANGSGKSTLLNLLDGLYFPASGTISAFGRPLTEEALRDDEFNFAFRRRVGLVFQDSDVQLFSASVLDEVNRRVDSALEALRIEKLRNRAPHRLSGGEKRRVALASLLTLQPDVWLMDEPTTGLDPRSQSWLIDFILEQRKQGRTMIVATHDLSVAEEIASTICVFSEEHQIVASGKTSDILSDHELLHRCNLTHYHARVIE